MAVAMFMHWPGVSSHEYDALMARLELDANPAAGSILHLAVVTEAGLDVCDVWQTEPAFRGFLDQRLLPIAADLGFSGLPEVRVAPLHNLFAADADMIDRIG